MIESQNETIRNIEVKKLKMILIEVTYLTAPIREEFIECVHRFIVEKDGIGFQRAWLCGEGRVLIEFTCSTMRIREEFLNAFKEYLADGIASDLPYDEQVVEYERYYIPFE